MGQVSFQRLASDPSLRWGFRLPAPAPLTPAKRLNLTHAARAEGRDDLMGTELLALGKSHRGEL